MKSKGFDVREQPVLVGHGGILVQPDLICHRDNVTYVFEIKAPVSGRHITWEAVSAGASLAERAGSALEGNVKPILVLAGVDKPERVEEFAKAAFRLPTVSFSSNEVNELVRVPDEKLALVADRYAQRLLE
jgi:hypothetical protein